MKCLFMFMGLCCTFWFDSCKEKEIDIKKLPFDISIVQVIDDKSKPSIGKSVNWSPCYKNNCFDFAQDGFDVLIKAKIGPEFHNKLMIYLNKGCYLASFIFIARPCFALTFVLFSKII